MENLVAVELKRRCRSKGVKLHYWKNSRGDEVNFLIRTGPCVSSLIQTTYAETASDIKNRERRALIKAMEELDIGEGIIITWEHEGEEDHGGKKITCIPLWKWLLTDPV